VLTSIQCQISQITFDNGLEGSSSTALEGTNPVTDATGGGLAHNNMQPIVQLYIMKL
jgi:hypothetical protein